MKKLLVLATVILTGCTMHPVVSLPDYEDSTSQSITIIDERSEDEKRTEVLSLLITDCSYGIARIGDDNVKPNRLEYLKQRLSGVESISTSKITVKEFSIYRNHQINLRGGVDPDAEGIVAGILERLECFSDSTYAGGYNIEENPKGVNAAIVKIVVDVDGQIFESRAIHLAPETPGAFPEAHDVWADVIKSTTVEAVDILIAKI